MITASEARDIAKSSDAALQVVLDRIGETIAKAAEDGKYELLYSGGDGDPTRIEDLIKSEGYSNFLPSRFWINLIRKLQALPLCYRVKIHRSEPKVYSGIGCIDGDDERTVRYSIKISW